VSQGRDILLDKLLLTATERLHLNVFHFQQHVVINSKTSARHGTKLRSLSKVFGYNISTLHCSLRGFILVLSFQLRMRNAWSVKLPQSFNFDWQKLGFRLGFGPSTDFIECQEYQLALSLSPISLSFSPWLNTMHWKIIK